MYCAKAIKRNLNVFVVNKVAYCHGLFCSLTATLSCCMNLSTGSFPTSVFAASYMVNSGRQTARKYGLKFLAQSVFMFPLYHTFSITFILVPNLYLSLLFLIFIFHLFILKTSEIWKYIIINKQIKSKSTIPLKVKYLTDFNSSIKVVQIIKAIYELEVSKSNKVGCYTRN